MHEQWSNPNNKQKSIKERDKEREKKCYWENRNIKKKLNSRYQEQKYTEQKTDKRKTLSMNKKLRVKLKKVVVDVRWCGNA